MGFFAAVSQKRLRTMSSKADLSAGLPLPLPKQDMARLSRLGVVLEERLENMV